MTLFHFNKQIAYFLWNQFLILLVRFALPLLKSISLIRNFHFIISLNLLKFDSFLIIKINLGLTFDF